MYLIYRKYARTLLDIALIVVSVFLILFLFSGFYQIAAPILFGLVIYAMIEPLAAWLHRKGMNKPSAALVSVLVFLIVIVTIISLAGMIFTFQLQQLAKLVASNQDSFRESFDVQLHWVQTQIAAMSPEVVQEIQKYISQFVEYGSQLLSNVLNWLFSVVTSVPTLLFNIVIGMILAFYLSSEINLWREWVRVNVPNSIKSVHGFLRDHVFSGIISYIKSQLVLVSLTFVIVFLGLLLIGVENAFSIAVLAAIFDILPILGIPVIFVPWIAYSFIVGDAERGIWLLVLLIVAFFTRQILEPKIAGESIGVSAFVMLASMVVSLSLFGVAGVIITPFLVILIKALYEQQYFKRWIHMPEDELK
jgi:sporulation integral membrane protein YtvI